VKHGKKVGMPFDKLENRIAGDVCTDTLQRYMLSTDASIFRKMPAAVVYPKNSGDVQQTVIFAVRQNFSVHARGAGSGLCGAAVGDGIVVDFTRYMNRLLQFNEKEGWFECEPGYRMGELITDIENCGLFFPPDPSSGEYATFGGMMATNASGSHSVKYGNVSDYLIDAEIVFADGKANRLSTIADTQINALPRNLQDLAALYRNNQENVESAYPQIKCNVAGYNLRGLVMEDRLVLHNLFAGAEGTLGIATKLRFKLIPKPASDSLVVAFFDDIVSAARAVQQTLLLGPSGIEIMDKSLLQLARETDDSLKKAIPANVDNVLLIEFDGSTDAGCAELAAKAQKLLLEANLTDSVHLAINSEEKKRFWAVRKAAVPLLYKLKGRKKILALVEDATVPIDRLTEFFKGLYAIFNNYNVRFVIYGHIAKGLLHTRPLLDLKDPNDVTLLRILADDVFDLVDGLHGTVSGEHGDGRLRTAYISRRYPSIYDLFLQTKRLLDPKGVFNPDIKIKDDPAQMASNLRFGKKYHSMDPRNLQLNWNEGFSNEVEKCHGCSKCTTVTNATRMCPVYKFTRDESASPKSKANVLRAITSGAVEDSLLQQKACRRVMELCFNCGSCKVECPSNINIPKLVMEAKAKQVNFSGSSVTDFITGHVGTAARWIHKTAPLVNKAIQLPAIKKLNQRLTGLSSDHNLALFNKRSLYSRLPYVVSGDTNRNVLYYAGCYAGYMRPNIGVASVRVLNLLGYTVYILPQDCCGLPALSKGMTSAARRQIKKNCSAWKQHIDRVDAIAVSCSSCGSALMQDWKYLVDGPVVEKISRKTVHISKLIMENRAKIEPLSIGKKIAYHQPCHLRLQEEGRSSIELLMSIPEIIFKDLKSHCCGMAGSWGLVAKNQVLSKTIGEQLITRINNSGADLAVTDCPTCEIQMSHLGKRPVVHPVEVTWACLVNPECPYP
jgi:FAD/FMN-containing dehydrogenase/Fe-S oxidoreductase